MADLLKMGNYPANIELTFAARRPVPSLSMGAVQMSGAVSGFCSKYASRFRSGDPSAFSAS
jgi:hypothetical protein